MKDEQERGRITAIRNRRRKAVEHALSMVPVIRQARAELGKPTLRAFADWLNERDYKTVRDKVWRAQTVSNLLSVDELVIRSAEDEHKRERAIEEALYRRRVAIGQDKSLVRAERDEKISQSRQRLEDAIVEARRIKFELNRSHSS